MAAVNKELPQQQQTPSSSGVAPLEDESLKRNTDCVYFLASPLTCKKGSECEYRHSEYARVNPRDCWYWLNGNCLNPKCSFRHPPLDGLMGPQVGNFAGPSPPAPPGPSVPSVPQNSAKQTVPCIFFQKGYCLKGDRCPFLHGPSPPNTKVQQVPATTAATEAPTFKKTFGGLEKCAQPKMNFHANASKNIEAPSQANAISKVGTARAVHEGPAGKRYPPPSGVTEEAPKYKETTAPVDNGNSRSRITRAHHGSLLDDQSFQNGKDADDSLRESSPGFDVLVDDKLGDDEYYHNEDQYVRMRSHDGRNLNEFDMGRHDDYNSMADVDPEIYHSRRGYDSYDHLPEKYAWDQRRASSERSLGEPSHYDRRGSYKSESPDFVQNSDLRHRLSKPRTVNGLKSVVNPDYNPDNHAEDRGYRGTRRDSRRSSTHESSRGNRLQGRIKFPRRPSPERGGNMHLERENERERNLGRSSPHRPQASGHQRGLRDRLSGRIQDESSEDRNHRGAVMRKDSLQADGANFAGPKSLAELKGTKQTDNKQQEMKSQQSVFVGKLRDTALVSSLGTEGDLSFEGPKPLSEILKRKRTASMGGTNSDEKEEIKRSENDENLTSRSTNCAADTGKQVTVSPAPEQTQAGEEENQFPAAEADEAEGEISNKKIKLTEDEKHPVMEEPLPADDGEEREFDEEYDQGDGEYEYEQDDEERYNSNEGETGDHEEDIMEEDDGDDDFAKKIGVSF